MFMKCLKVLAVDREYLIAMDVERILGDAFGCSVTVATPPEAEHLVRRNRYDLAVVSYEHNRDTFRTTLEKIRQGSDHLLFSAADHGLATGVPGFADISVILKPFRSETLERVVSSLFKPPRIVAASQASAETGHLTSDSLI
jgi:two-component SAPR family response regulator